MVNIHFVAAVKTTQIVAENVEEEAVGRCGVMCDWLGMAITEHPLKFLAFILGLTMMIAEIVIISTFGCIDYKGNNCTCGNNKLNVGVQIVSTLLCWPAVLLWSVFVIKFWNEEAGNTKVSAFSTLCSKQISEFMESTICVKHFSSVSFALPAAISAIVLTVIYPNLLSCIVGDIGFLSYLATSAMSVAITLITTSGMGIVIPITSLCVILIIMMIYGVYELLKLVAQSVYDRCCQPIADIYDTELKKAEIATYGTI